MDSFAWQSCIEHPPMIVNGTKDPLRSILRRGSVANQLLLSGQVPSGIPKPFRSIVPQVLDKSYPRAAGELSTSSARKLAAVRVSTPSFSKISRTCFFTVDFRYCREWSRSHHWFYLEQATAVFRPRGGLNRALSPTVLQNRTWV
jgi:hypothetical protein